MSSKSKVIGTKCETALVKHLKTHGFPTAHRRDKLHGSKDEGDVQADKRLIFEVKGGHAAEQASDLQLELWMQEADKEREHAQVELVPLVVKRKGKGLANPGRWWAFLRVSDFDFLYHGPTEGKDPADDILVRFTVDDMLTFLRSFGYGEPLGEEE